MQADAASSFASPDLVTAKSATTLALTRRGLTVKDTWLAFPAVSKRYWRLVFDEAGGGAATRQVSVGEVMAVASPTSLTRGEVYGGGTSHEYAVNESRMDNGDVFRTLRAGPIPTRQFSFADLTSAQLDEVLTMFHATRGGSTSLLWCEEHNSTALAATAAEQECVYGRLQRGLGSRQSDFAVYQPDGLELVGRGREFGA